MEVDKLYKVIQESSFDEKFLNDILLKLTSEEKEELDKLYKEKNEELKSELEEYKEKITQIRNKLYNDIKNDT